MEELPATQVQLTIDDHREKAKILYAEAKEIRVTGLDKNAIPDAEKVKELEKLADGHILLLKSLIRREKKRRNNTNGKT